MDLYHERRHKYTLDYLKTKYLLLFFEFECIDPSIMGRETYEHWQAKVAGGPSYRLKSLYNKAKLTTITSIKYSPGIR